MKWVGVGVCCALRIPYVAYALAFLRGLWYNGERDRLRVDMGFVLTGLGGYIGFLDIPTIDRVSPRMIKGFTTSSSLKTDSDT